MKSKNIQQLAVEIIEPIAQSLGYTLVEVSYKKQFDGMVLAVCIDKEGGININDCQTLSKALDFPLEEADITNGVAYNLTISSYGLDRPLKNEYDFNKFRDKEIIVKFYKPYLNVKELKCKLLNFNNDIIKVEYENNILEINLKETAIILPYVKF